MRELKSNPTTIYIEQEVLTEEGNVLSLPKIGNIESPW